LWELAASRRPRSLAWVVGVGCLAPSTCGVRATLRSGGCAAKLPRRTGGTVTKHKSPEDRRAEILAAARACFIRNGYAHTRVEDIAREAGLSKGGVYCHFSTKREIFDALYSEQQARTAAVVVDSADSGAPAAALLARLGSAVVQNFAEDDKDHGKFLIVLAEMGIREPEVLDRVAGAHWRYVESLTSILSKGQASGELREVDSEAVALCLKFFVDGIEQGLALGYTFDRQRLVAAALDLLLTGLRAPSTASPRA